MSRRNEIETTLEEALADGRSGPSGHEVTLGGRKYLLVPIDSVPPLKVRDLLTSRELEIAKLVARGRLNKQIAADLAISEWTVSTHLRRIFAKLDVDTRAAMVTKCFDALRTPEE